MELVMFYLLIGFGWTVVLQIGLKALDSEEAMFTSLDIGVNIIIWPYSVTLFVKTFIKEYFYQS